MPLYPVHPESTSCTLRIIQAECSTMIYCDEQLWGIHVGRTYKYSCVAGNAIDPCSCSSERIRLASGLCGNTMYHGLAWTSSINNHTEYDNTIIHHFLASSVSDTQDFLPAHSYIELKSRCFHHASISVMCPAMTNQSVTLSGDMVHAFLCNAIDDDDMASE